MKIDKTTTRNCFEYSQVYVAFIGNKERNNFGHLLGLSHINSDKLDYIFLFDSRDAIFEANKHYTHAFFVDISQLSAYDVSRKINMYLTEKFDTQKLSILFNVTSIPRDIILLLLYIFEHMHSANVKIEYFSTDEYGSFDYKDYLKPQNVHFFGGKPKLNLPTRMIVFPGHEYNATSILVAYYRPISIIIGYSSPEKSTFEINAAENRKAMDKSINDSIKFYSDECSVSIETVDFSSNNPCLLRNELNEWINRKKDERQFNNIIASFTTRLSTVGLYLFWRDKPDYQIVSTSGAPVDLMKSTSKETPKEILQFSIF